MIRKIVFIILFLTLSINSFAHQDYYGRYQYGKIILGFNCGWGEYEVNEQIKIIAYLCEQHINLNYDTTKIPFILIDFNHYSCTDTSSLTTISYTNLKQTNIDYEYITDEYSFAWLINEDGIKIYQKSRIFKVEPLLKLIDFAINNLDYLKENQIKMNSPCLYDDFTTLSLPFDKIDSIVNKNNKKVENTLQIKVYRNITKVEYYKAFDYYYQNDNFFIYYPREKENFASKTFELNNIEQVLETDFGYLVFDTDTTFYFIPGRFDTISKQYTIKKYNDFFPIREFTNENTPSRIIFYYYNDYNLEENNFPSIFEQGKIAFFPDYDTLIENYGNYEKLLLNKLLQMKGNDSLIQENEFYKSNSILINHDYNLNRIIIAGLVLIIIGLIGILIYWKKNEKCT